MYFRPALVATAMLTTFLGPAIAFAEDGGPVRQQSSVARFDPDDFVSLDARPGAQFTDIPVETASGARIGVVKVVGLASDGSVARVLVGLYAGGTVWIVADALRYDRNAGLLLTNLKHIEASADREPF